MTEDSAKFPTPLVEPLTRREINILMHLEGDRTNGEIAALESLALSSVKWYVQQIYTKLGVNKRREAIARAKELGLLTTETAPYSAPVKLKNNLPVQLTSFIGREKELKEVCSLLSDEGTRLVTLTGPGGTGKTRLALKIAEAMIDVFPDGVYLVELAALGDPGLVLGAIAAALGLLETPGKALQDTLAGYLEHKHLLLILDNCEHLVDECARLADWLLKDSPRLRLLVTSREILGISGETSLRVPPLEFPDTKRLPGLEALGQVAAVRLFVERAKQTAPGFTLDESNAAAVAQICQRLDGLPLAIELAAARVRMMTVNQIASRLDNVFRLLTGGSRSALPRQQTLKAAMDWGYALLSRKERLAQQRLSVFAGSWTLEAAEAVCTGNGIESDEVLDLLGELVDKSLVLLSRTESEEGRYRMLETVRQYAHDRLLESGEGEATRDRHLDYYLQMGRGARRRLRGRKQLEWLSRLESERENLRLALEWSLSGRFFEGLRLADALMWYWHLHSRDREGVSWLERLLTAEAEARGSQPLVVGEQSNSYLRVWARAASAEAFLANFHAGSFSMQQRRELVTEGIALCRSLGETACRELAWALQVAGNFTTWPSWEEGRREGQRYLEESLNICRQNDYAFLRAHCLFLLSSYPMDYGQWQPAGVYLEESLAIFREMEDPEGIATVLIMLDRVARIQGEYSRAYALRREGQEYFRIVGNLDSLYNSYIDQLYNALELGEDARAFQQAQEALDYYRSSGNIDRLSWALARFSEIEWARGNYPRAEEIGQEACALSQKHPGSTHFVQPGATPYVWSHYFLGRMALSQGNLSEARRLFELVLAALPEESERPVGLVMLLSGWVGLLSAEGKMAQAVKVCGAMDEIYQQFALWRPSRDRHEYAAAQAAARQALGKNAYTQAWNEGKTMTLRQALEEVRKE